MKAFLGGRFPYNHRHLGVTNQPLVPTICPHYMIYDLALTTFNDGFLIRNRILKCFEQKPSIRVFPKIGVPQNGWFIREIPIKMDDLGVPPFSETSTQLH